MKPPVTEELPEQVSTSTPTEGEVDLSEHLRRVRGRRAYALLMSLKGKIHINIDIDELRGRNRR